MQYDIFISYRRLDSQGRVEGRDIARLLTKELKLYGYNVFFDYSEIKDNDFVQCILPAVQTCKIFILILSKDALTRCVNKDDWVRREILEAYKCNKKIITVNPSYSFNNFPNDLPEEMDFLRTIQMSPIDLESNFEVTVEKMVKDRILTEIPGVRIANIRSEAKGSISFCISGKQFEMPDEFFNIEVYNAIKRSYE